MAKLSARGRTEVWRVEKTTTTENPKPGEVKERRQVIAMMSDGNILRRVVGTWYDGLKTDTGWRVWRKVKADAAPGAGERILERYLAAGCVRVGAAPLDDVAKVREPPKMTESAFREHCDSNDGICLAYGAIRDGYTEPDARDYHCDDCGADRVYGMEEALIGGDIVIVGGSEDRMEA